MKDYKVSVFNTITKKYEMVSVTKEIYEVYMRDEWNINKRRNDFNKDYQPMVDGYTNFIFRDLHGKLMNSNRINRTLRNIVNDYNHTEEAVIINSRIFPLILLCSHKR